MELENPLDRFDATITQVASDLNMARDRLGDALQGTWLLRELLRRAKSRVESLELEIKLLRSKTVPPSGDPHGKK